MVIVQEAVIAIQSNQHFIFRYQRLNEECHFVHPKQAIKQSMFVIGWIRRMFQSKEMKQMQMPPDSVVRLSVQWHDQEMLHLVFRSLRRLQGGLDESDLTASRSCEHFCDSHTKYNQLSMNLESCLSTQKMMP